MQKTSTLEYLVAHGVKPSVQRIAVMEYLDRHCTHPTADEIYSALHPQMPTLSRTTVYNTLRLLAEQKVVERITIDERKVCYDANLEEHAHFFCTRCGQVYDVALAEDGVERHAEMPEGFCPEHADLYFRGCCRSCAEATALKEE